MLTRLATSVSRSQGDTGSDGPGRDAYGRGVRRRLAAALAVCGLTGLSACHGLYNPPPKDPDALADYKEANDPYEPLNRKMYGVQMWAFKYVIKPVGKAWIWVLPSPVRRSLGNIAETWNQPVVFFGDVGAARPRRAGDAFVRYAINMTAGAAGLFDVAKYAGYPHHDGGAGLMMASWGMPSGPYLFVPGTGPTTIRDGVGTGVDIVFQPLTWVPSGYGLLTFYTAYSTAGTINAFADHIQDFDQVERDSLDPYATIRSAWQQNRQSQVDTIRNDHRATTPDWYN